MNGQNVRINICFCFLLTSGALFYQDPAGAVLKSPDNSDGNASTGSTLVSAADNPTPPDAPSGDQTISRGPETTLKFTVKPKPQDAAPKDTSSTDSADEGSIFKSYNPHAVKPESNSPFIKQVGAVAPGYQRQAVINHGKVTGGLQAGGQATITQTQTATQTSSG